MLPLLLITVLLILVTGSSTLGARTLDLPAQPQPDSRLIANRVLPGVYTVPSTCSVPIVPDIVTEEEIELRQYQVDFAKYIEEQATLDQQATLTLERDVLAIEKFRLDCEIMVLRARQLLQTTADGAVTPPSTPDITAQEIALRNRQFQIAKQIDEEELISHKAGIVSLNSVWTARRARIDAEILLHQAEAR